LNPAARSRAAGALGLAASLWALLVPAVGACASAPYSHVSQFISELGASGAAHGALVSWLGFAPIGAFVLGFLALAAGVLPGSRLATAGFGCLAAVGAAYLASAAFPCDPGCPSTGSLSQSVHNLFGLLEYLGAVSGVLLLFAAFRRARGLRVLARGSAAAALLVALGFAGILIPGLEPVRGISQRIAEGAIFLWIALASGCLLRAEEPAR
jgi:hypothetical protein